MVSKNDLAIGILVLIAGIIIYSFAPSGPMYMPMPAHTNTHYIGGAIAILFGLVGLVLYKKTSKITAAVSVLSVILGVVFILDAPPSGALFMALPAMDHGMHMQVVGGLTALVGIVGVAGAAMWKKK
jgi:hypothetical protein